MSVEASGRRVGGTDLAIVLGSIVAVVTAAIVQHIVVLGVQIALPTLVVPTVVGAVFGLVLRRVIRFRKQEQSLREALEEREREITSLNQDLEAKVEIRNEELRQKEAELLQSQKMEAVGRLAGGVAHDFNNILTSIIGGASILEQMLPDADPQIREILGDVRAASDRAARLTRQLLTLSRKQILDPEVLSVSKLAESMLPMLRRIIPEDISLTVEIDPDCNPVWADRSQLEQLILNLCVNARDALPSGGQIALSIRSAEPTEVPQQLRGEGPGYCLLTVRDDGVGMSEEVRSRIFEPFFTTKETGKGSGLGLSVVFGIVERSRGAVQVESRPGEGSSFHVYLPLTRRQSLEVVEPAERPRIISGSQTILVIEDNAAVRRLIRQVLAPVGYQLIEASSGDEGIVIARSHEGEIHLVLSDVIMPGRSGPEAAEEIATHHPESRFLFMTGYPGEEIEKRVGKPLAPSTLLKPFDAKKLLASVEHTLGAAPSGRAVAK